MRPFQWSSIQRIVAFRRDISHIRFGQGWLLSATFAPLRRYIAGLRSGGQIDSDCSAVSFQITNGHCDNSYRDQPCQFVRIVQKGSCEKPHDGLFNLLPGFSARVDQIEVAGSRNFQEGYIFSIFSIFPGALLLGGDVVAAEGGRDDFVVVAVDEPLAAVRNRELHGIGFAVVVGNFRRSAVEEFDDRIVAEVELVGTLQVEDSGEGNDPSQARFVRGEAKSQLTSCGVSDDDKLLRVETMFPAVLSQKLVGAANVGKSVGPA